MSVIEFESGENVLSLFEFEYHKLCWHAWSTTNLRPGLFLIKWRGVKTREHAICLLGHPLRGYILTWLHALRNYSMHHFSVMKNLDLCSFFFNFSQGWIFPLIAELATCCILNSLPPQDAPDVFFFPYNGKWWHNTASSDLLACGEVCVWNVWT
jgi:hypothetical protein